MTHYVITVGGIKYVPCTLMSDFEDSLPQLLEKVSEKLKYEKSLLSSPKFVFNLPDAVLIPFYSQWLNVKSFSVLDTAICNQTRRPEFLAKLKNYNVCFKQTNNERDSENHNLKYMTMRSLCAEHIHIHTWCYSAFSSSKNVLKLFSKVRTVSLGQGFHSNQISHVFKFCGKTMETMKVAPSSFIDYESWSNGLPLCQKLTRLEVVGHENLSPDCLRIIGLALSQLTHLNLSHCNKVSDLALTKMSHVCTFQHEWLRWEGGHRCCHRWNAPSVA